MFDKKGLSGIVTTVLIVLVAVAAVVIVGNVVLNLVDKSSGEIEGATACTGLRFEVTSCSWDGGDWSVSAKHSSGNSQIVEASVVLEKADGSTDVVDAENIPDYLQTIEVYSIDSGDGKLYVGASVVPGVLASDGNLVDCPESAQVSCVDVS